MPPPSPKSLLWAHQLRREHIALVSSLSALESSTTASISSTTSTLTTRLEKLECVLDEIRVELEKIKKLVGELETGRDRERDEIGRKVRAEMEVEVIANVREEVRILKEMVEGLMKGRGKLVNIFLFLTLLENNVEFLYDREYRDSRVLNAHTSPSPHPRTPGISAAHGHSFYPIGVVNRIIPRHSHPWPFTRRHPRVCASGIPSWFCLKIR